MTNIVNTDISKELTSSYIDYAVNTLVDRAIPDIRDGLKPSQRRIIVSMMDQGLWSTARYRKCALLCGYTSSTYHPHGEAVVYPTAVRMAQNFSLRYPLIDGQGNFGNIGGSPAAAMRYTESRMSSASEDMLADIKVNGEWSVPVVKNYDETKDEPTVLPSRFPNLLCNGASGIAVGWATEIPPHNIKEVCAGLVEMIKNPEITDDKLLSLIKGPDFPGGGIVHTGQGLQDIYRKGIGTITVSGRVKIDTKGNSSTITVYELPYGTTTEDFLDKTDKAFKEGKLSGISSLKDASSLRMDKPVNVIFYLKRGEDPQVVLNQLYQNTPLRKTYSANMVALIDNGRGERVPPKSPLALRVLMRDWIAFRRDLILSKSKLRITALNESISKLEALIKAIDPLNIDKVVSIIRNGTDEQSVITKLCKELSINADQAKNILAITLRSLMKLEVEKLKNTLSNQQKELNNLKALIADNKLINDELINDLSEISKNYGDERRTGIEGAATELTEIDLTPEEQVIITLSANGYIKRTALDSFNKTGRNAKGVNGASVSDDDEIIKVFTASTHEELCIFTNTGFMYKLRVFDIPETTRGTKGRALVNLINIDKDKIVGIVPVNKYDDRNLLFGTKLGQIKKSELKDYENHRSSTRAIKLMDGDEVVQVTLTTGSQHLFMVTEGGLAVRVPEQIFRVLSKQSQGKAGIKLNKDDRVCALLTIQPEDSRYVLTLTKSGIGKRTLLSEYEPRNGRAKGVIATKITDEMSKLATAVIVDDSSDVIISSSAGKIVRIGCNDIRVCSRNSKGVHLLKLDGDAQLSNASVI